MGNALSTLQAVYFAMQTNLDLLLTACQSQDQRDSVMAQYVAARQNYWKCVNQMFHEDDPALVALESQLKPVINSLQNANQQLGDIAKVINDMTEAVTIGAQIAAKVVAL